MAHPHVGLAEDTQIYEASDGTLYIGVTDEPGMATSENGWQISRILPNGSMQWAEGTESFDKIMDNAESYTYGSA